MRYRVLATEVHRVIHGVHRVIHMYMYTVLLLLRVGSQDTVHRFPLHKGIDGTCQIVLFSRRNEVPTVQYIQWRHSRGALLTAIPLTPSLTDQSQSLK